MADWLLLVGLMMKWTNKVTAPPGLLFSTVASIANPFQSESELMWDCLFNKQYVLFPPWFSVKKGKKSLVEAFDG